MSMPSTSIFMLSPVLLIAGGALAQSTPSNLSDLVGARGAGGETQLQARGYTHVKTSTSGNSTYSYWWNGARKQCISVRTADGRYDAIVETLPFDCDRGGSNANRPSSGWRPPATTLPSYSPPEIIMGRNGQGEVIFRQNNCVVYFNSAGIRTRYLPSCSSSQRSQAATAMAGYRREQGMNGRPVADHSPIYRDFSSDRINLICHGDGTRLTYSPTMGYTWDDSRQRYVPQSIPGYDRQEYDTFLTIQLDGNRGRIRLPQSMVPPIHSGESRGWRDLDELRYTRTQVKARYKLNGLNHPNVTLNRLTGRINISGQRGFNGTCVATDRGGLRWR